MDTQLFAYESRVGIFFFFLGMKLLWCKEKKVRKKYEVLMRNEVSMMMEKNGEVVVRVVLGMQLRH